MLNYKEIKSLVVIANRLDSLGLIKEADVIDSIIKEASFLDSLSKKLREISLATAIGLGGVSTLYPSSTTDMEVVTRQLQDFNDSDFHMVKVKKGQTLGDIAEEYYPGIDSVTGTNIILDINKILFDVTIDSSKLKIGQVIKVPKVNSLKAIGYEEEIGMGLTDTDSVREPSSNIVSYLKQKEDFKDRIYDTKARADEDLTIGFGHKLTKKEILAFKAGKEFEIHGILIRPGKTITEQQGETIFQGDVEKTKDIIDRCNFTNLNQNHYDALLSFVFNVGHVPNSIRKLIIEGKFDEVPEEMIKYNKAGSPNEVGSLTERRNEEIALWNSGTYPGELSEE